MKRFIGLVAISLALTNALANESKDEFFGYSGGVGTFSKVGFNDAKVDTTRGCLSHRYLHHAIWANRYDL